MLCPHQLTPLLVVALVGIVGCGDGARGAGGVTGAGGNGGTIIANAGADRNVAEGTVVSVEATGAAEVFAWSQLRGPTVTLNGADQAEVSFEAPWITEESVDIELELTVIDGEKSATDTVIVTVTNTHFVLFLADKVQARRVELFRAPLDGANEPIKLSKTPAPNGDVQSFSASPDGHYVAYAGDLERDDEVELFVVDSRGGESTKLGNSLIAGPFVPIEFAWSPDSTHVAYRSDPEVDGHFDLYVSTALLAHRDQDERRISRYLILCRVGNRSESGFVLPMLSDDMK